MHFTGITYNASGPDYAGFAVYAFGMCGAVNVSDSVFDNIGREGIAYWGVGTTGTYTRNTYTGKGLGNWLDYAVEVTNRAVVTISNSRITNNLGTATVDGSNSAGIIVLLDDSTATITGNTITGNDIAIKVGYNAPVSTATAYAHNNNIFNNVKGTLHGTAGGEFDATDNWWGAADGPSGSGPGSGDIVGTEVTFEPFWMAPYPVSIAMEPSSTTIYPKDTQQYTMTGTLADESTADVILECTFTSGDTSIATIDTDTGFATAVASGSATINANCFDGAFLKTATLGVATSDQPTANAGPDSDGFVGSSFVLDGSGSSDPASRALTYLWTEAASNPEQGLIEDPTQSQATFTPGYAGTYAFSLVVDNGSEASAADTVEVFVADVAHEQLVVAAEGGTIVVSDPGGALDRMRISIPAGALSEDTMISVGRLDNPPSIPDEMGRSAGVAVVLGPSGLTFAKPVTIYVPFDYSGSHFGIYYVIFVFNNTTRQWETIPAALVSGPPHYLAAEVTHFSLYQAGVQEQQASGGGWCTLVVGGKGSGAGFGILILAMLAFIAVRRRTA